MTVHMFVFMLVSFKFCCVRMFCFFGFCSDPKLRFSKLEIHSTFISETGQDAAHKLRLETHVHGTQ